MAFEYPQEKVHTKKLSFVSKHMKFCCPRTMMIGKVYQNSRFTILKAWGNFRNHDIIVLKMCKSFFYVLPFPCFKGMLTLKSFL